MNTLKVIQSLSKIGKILSRIVFVCCIVGFCGCIVGIISLSLGAETFKLGGVTIHSMIENDFHDRKDLMPNVCAVYTEEAYRGQGIAGRLLNIVVEDMRSKGISPLYLVTDHTGFYERYGWAFLCMVQGDGEPEMTRMYVHR